MSDYKLPELPSDEELGIAGLSEEDFAEDADDVGATAPPPPQDPPKDPPKGPPPSDTGKKKAAPPPPDRPAPAWRGPLTLVVLLLAVWISRPVHTMPSTEAANASDEVFSSARALTELVDIARQPHPPGSPEHARVRGLLLERLRSLGLEPEVQTTTYLPEADGEASGATVRNLVARIPGTASTGALVLTAHYDSRTFAPGAGDDGTGVVTILETLRALQTGPPLRNDLIVLITDAEELGLLGARAWVDRHPWMDDVRMVISIEMRGGGGPSIMFETNEDNGWVMDRLDAADPHPLANSVSVDIYRRMPRDTDFTPFRLRGVQGLNFAAIGRAHVYHQVYDTPENLDEGTLQHHGARVLAMTRDLGNQDLTTVDAPSRAFVTLPFLGLVTYPVAWALPITGVLALLLLAAGGLTLLRGGGWRGMLGGVGLGLLALALTAGAGQALLVWARGRHPEFGSLMGSAFHVEGWYVLALAAVALFTTSLALSLARRRVHRGALFFGAMLPVVILAVVAGFVAPAAAPNLQGPAFMGLLAVCAVSLAGPKRDTGWVTWALALLLAIPVFGFLVTLLELVWVAMSFTLAAVLGGAMVATLLLAAPALDGLVRPNRWWAPATALVAFALFTFLGARTATPSAERPAPSTLIYVQDQGGPGAPVRGLWVSRADAGIEWAREATGSPLDREEAFEGLRLGSGSWLVGDAPAVTLSPPRARIAADTVVNGRRRLTLAVAPGTDAEGVGFRVEPPARLLTLGDAELGADTGGLAAVWHEGRPYNDSIYVVTVAQDPGMNTLDLEILQHHQRPWTLLPSNPWERPAELAPNVMNRSDRAVIRSRLRLLLNGATPDSAGVAIGDAALAMPATATDSAAATPPDTGAVATPPDTGAVRTPPDTGAVTPPDTSGAGGGGGGRR